MKNIKNNPFYYFITAIFLALISVTISSCSDDDEVMLDTINPYVISYNPVSGVGGIDLSSNLVLTFDDIVEKGEGFITITSDTEQATQIIDVNSDQVEISNVGRILTINPQDFLSGRPYKVVVDAGIVKDQAGNLFFGMPDNETWTFTSGGNPGDLDPPELVETMPSNGSTNGATTAISLTFNEDVKVGSGNIEIFNSSDIAVATVDAEGELVTIDGETISVELPTSLDFGQTYYVKIAAGVIKDIGGNAFAGFTDSSSWSFTTTAGSGSELVFHLPMDSDLNDDSGNKLDATLGATAIAEVEFVNDATRGLVAKFNAGSFAQFPRHDLLRPSETQSFSVNLWLKLAGTDSDPSIIANKDWGSGGNPGWLLCTDDGHEYAPGNGTDHGWIVNNAGNPKKDGNRMDWKAAGTSPQAPALSDDQWHMVTMNWDRSSNVLEVYIDGVRFGDSSYDLSVLEGSLWDEEKDYKLTLWEDGTGQYNASDDRRAAMTGLMDELSYYNRVLTVDEITTLYAN